MKELKLILFYKAGAFDVVRIIFFLVSILDFYNFFHVLAIGILNGSNISDKFFCSVNFEQCIGFGSNQNI